MRIEEKSTLMKEQSEYKKSRIILAIIDIIAVLLAYHSLGYIDTLGHAASIVLTAVSVVISAMVIFCRLNYREIFSLGQNLLDAILFILVFLWTVYCMCMVL